MKEFKSEHMLIQLDEFQPKSSEPSQEVTKRLFPTCSMKMGTIITNGNLPIEIWWICWVLGIILWKNLAKEQLSRIEQFLWAFFKSA